MDLEVADLTVDGHATFRETIFARHFSRLGPTAVQGELTVSQNAELAGALAVAGHLASSNPGVSPTLASSALSPGITASVGLDSTDTSGSVVLTSGAPGSTLSSGDSVTLNFASPFPARPRVQLTTAADDALDIVYWVGATLGAVATTTQLTVFVLTPTTVGAPAGAELRIDFLAVGPEPEVV